MLALVEPLDDMIQMVSGDPDEMARSEERWGQIATAYSAFGEEIGASVESDIPTWAGQDADAARDQIAALGAIVQGVSTDAQKVQSLLAWARTLAETIYAVIKSILAELVSWLLTNGLVALALSPATFGSSVAGFVVRASIKGSMMFTKALSKLQKAFNIFGKIGKALFKILSKTSYRGNPAKKLWKEVMMKALIGGGLGAISPALNAHSTYTSIRGESGWIDGGSSAPGQISVDPAELDQLKSSLETHAGRSESLHQAAQDAAVAEMTWGLPGVMGMESAYQDSCDAIDEIGGDITNALNGNATKVSQCAEDYRAADEEMASAFDSIGSDLN
ncbi:hypothetical protein [Glycomyces sp. NPDC048151]|uniref:hypothetical protein n=1 Tax=Glycomyces sp. NPDC048151 TaxID=3364002 RepID=UPI003711D098